MTLRPNDNGDKKPTRRNDFKKTVNGDDGSRRREDARTKEKRACPRSTATSEIRPPTTIRNARTSSRRGYSLFRQWWTAPTPQTTSLHNSKPPLSRLGSYEYCLGNFRSHKSPDRPRRRPMFVRLLASPNNDVREQVVWALCNVAGESPKCRDFVLGHGALPGLLAQFNEKSTLSMLRTATWTLSNFCRGKPQPDFEQMKVALPILAYLIIHSDDQEVLADSCWALLYLFDGDNGKIQVVIEAGVCPRLVQLLLTDSPSVLVPAFRTVGNIVTGEDSQTQAVIDNQGLSCLLNLLIQNPMKTIKKEA
ncbi:OLC1v1009042C1 [Oldenlandia corymbosa var. corymbosa]|uniref:OLC1v1009042C1 n=1 Tax=Oldenlandia corymbosa var. corymbosa TaxID=529605 RepID=A0AAV1DQG0_OLDCO|nr:OLC1v1009042C1 [Oldenlandia corymbosa var. corymbosa]